MRTSLVTTHISSCIHRRYPAWSTVCGSTLAHVKVPLSFRLFYRRFDEATNKVHTNRRNFSGSYCGRTPKDKTLVKEFSERQPLPRRVWIVFNHGLGGNVVACYHEFRNISASALVPASLSSPPKPPSPCLLLHSGFCNPDCFGCAYSCMYTPFVFCSCKPFAWSGWGPTIA